MTSVSKDTACRHSEALSSAAARLRGWRWRWRCARASAPIFRSSSPIRRWRLRPSRDPRATAIVAACRRLLDAIGVWDQVAAEAQPILDMVVTDSKLEDATRPVFLTFAGNVEPGEPFAHMVENRHLIDALVGARRSRGHRSARHRGDGFRPRAPTAST